MTILQYRNQYLIWKTTERPVHTKWKRRGMIKLSMIFLTYFYLPILHHVHCHSVWTGLRRFPSNNRKITENNANKDINSELKIDLFLKVLFNIKKLFVHIKSSLIYHFHLRTHMALRQFYKITDSLDICKFFEPSSIRPCVITVFKMFVKVMTFQYHHLAVPVLQGMWYKWFLICFIYQL